MTFQQMMADDYSNVFLNTDEFGEAVTYFPVCGNGSSRSISVVIDEFRDDEIVEGNTTLAVSVMRVTAKNHATLGIDNPQRGDKLLRAADLPAATGTDTKQYFLHRVTHRDAAGLVMEFARKRETETGPHVGRTRRYT